MVKRGFDYYFGFGFYIAFLLCLISGDDNVCHQAGSCLCHFDDGRSLNLVNLVPGDKFISASKGNLTFYYHGCVDSELNLEIENISVDKCRQKLSLCLYNATDRSLTTLGLATDSKFLQVDKFPKSTELRYSSNNIETHVILTCTVDYPETLLVVRSLETGHNKLQVFSPLACRALDYVGLSTGSKLLIMFFVFFLVYLVGGSCIAYFLRGARGKEVIPNIDFWTSLPGLVRDGIVFIMSGCNARMVPTPETYDQI